MNDKMYSKVLHIGMGLAAICLLSGFYIILTG